YLNKDNSLTIIEFHQRK
ncbi:unnamed protein product, partial [Rotaria socialis]